MSEISIQDAALVLGELQDNEGYKALDKAVDARFTPFRQAVERVEIRCFEMYQPNPRTESEIRGLLGDLQAQCTDSLARFRPFLDRALAALDG